MKTTRTLLTLAVLLNLACGDNDGAAPGGGAGGGSDSDTVGQACSNHSDCNTGEACVPNDPAAAIPGGPAASSDLPALGVAKQALVDEQCLEACEMSCQGDQCNLCEYACGGEPECEDCADICSAFPGDEAACEAGCEQSCVDGSEQSEQPGSDDRTSVADDRPRVQPQEGSGTCRVVESDDEEESDESDTTQDERNVEWAGVWQVKVSYVVKCDLGLAGLREGSQEFTVAGRIEGANDDLSIGFDPDYEMKGSGRNDALTVSGRFPARDHRDEKASRTSADNNITLRITDVDDANNASGELSGTFRTAGFSGDCSIHEGRVEMTR